MTRLVPITLAMLLAVPLMGARCTQKEIDHYSALLTGTQPSALVYPSSSEPVAYGVLLVEPESSEEVVSVAVVVEPEPSSVEPPEPPPCDPVIWRGTIYDCTMKIVLGYVE